MAPAEEAAAGEAAAVGLEEGAALEPRAFVDADLAAEEWRRAEEPAAAPVPAAPVEGSEASGSEHSGPPRDLAEVERVLEDIFEYYAPKRSAPRLTSARFKRICEDSRLIDRQLPSAQVDVTFSQMCRGSPHMSLPQFRDAVVRLAAMKYPMVSRSDAVLRIYDESLAAFGNAQDPVFDDLDGDVLAVLNNARSGLQTLYKGYFAAECTRQPSQRGLAAAFGEAERGFVLMLADFEVVPGLSSSAVAHAVFRRVTETRRIPEDIVAELGTTGRLPGHAFTFAHFAVAVALAAMRCFSDGGAVAVVRLFDWMEASKGRVVFAGAYPGLLPPGAALRLGASPAIGAGSGRSTLEGRGEPGRGPWRLPPASGGSPPCRPADPEPDAGASATSLGVSCASTAGRTHARRGSSRLSAAAAAAAAAGTSEPARRVVAQIFGHYAALGDPLNRTALSSLKFNRFLRDCGIVRSDLSEAQAFAPAARRRSGELGTDGGGGGCGGGGDASRRSRSTGCTGSSGGSSSGGSISSSGSHAAATVAERRRHLASIAEGAPRGPRLSISGGSMAALMGGALPLRVFPSPPLSQVDSDLIFVQAVKQQELELLHGGSAGSAGSRQSLPAGGAARRSDSSTRPRRGRNMTMDGFVRALLDVAARVLGTAAADGAGAGLLEELCHLVLEPLLEAHGEACLAGPGGLHSVVEFVLEPETESLLVRCQAGLDRLFRAYAVDSGRARPHWCSDSLTKFAQDFQISEELTHLPLQRIFQDCLEYESYSGGLAAERRELSQAGFVLALALISQKVYMGLRTTAPMDRLQSLFSRINSIATLPALSARLGVQSDTLLPVPRPRRTSSNPAALHRRLGRRRELAGQMSWADLTASN